MFHLELEPRFSDTDALGHISNTTLPVLVRAGQDAGFPYFSPDP